MKELDGGAIIRGAIMMEKPRVKGFSIVSDTRGGGDYTVGKVVRLESSGERYLS